MNVLIQVCEQTGRSENEIFVQAYALLGYVDVVYVSDLYRRYQAVAIVPNVVVEYCCKILNEESEV